jgi:hypothetical protein
MSDMQSAASSGSSNLPEPISMSTAALVSTVRSQAQTIAVQDEPIASLTHQLEWFRRQTFGQKSERSVLEPDPSQLHLGETFPVSAERVEQRKSIPAHTRRTVQRDGAESGEELKFFDETQVPARTITLVHEDVRGLSPDQYDVIGEPDRPTPWSLPGPEVSAAGDQAQEQREDSRPAGADRGSGGTQPHQISWRIFNGTSIVTSFTFSFTGVWGSTGLPRYRSPRLPSPPCGNIFLQHLCGLLKCAWHR